MNHAKVTLNTRWTRAMDGRWMEHSKMELSYLSLVIRSSLLDQIDQIDQINQINQIKNNTEKPDIIHPEIPHGDESRAQSNASTGE